MERKLVHITHCIRTHSSRLKMLLPPNKKQPKERWMWRGNLCPCFPLHQTCIFAVRLFSFCKVCLRSRRVSIQRVYDTLLVLFNTFQHYFGMDLAPLNPNINLSQISLHLTQFNIILIQTSLYLMNLTHFNIIFGTDLTPFEPFQHQFATDLAPFNNISSQISLHLTFSNIIL